MAPLRHLSAKLLDRISSNGEPSMGEVTTIGLDLAKHVFQVHGVDAEGATVLRKQLRRAQVLAFFSRLPRCVSGQVQVMFGTMTGSIEYIRTGTLRALAVTTATRAEALPYVPTVAEFVPGYEASTWYGIGAPKNTPTETIDKLNKEINAGLADSKMKAQLADLGGTALAGSPAEFGRIIADETEKWAKVVKFAGIKPQ
jgi:tripartite-type tricarboxylate transporter receptor subunit TctC